MNPEVEIFISDNGVELEVKTEKDTVWLNQQQISQLFETTRENIVQHISNIYKENELSEYLTCKNFLQVQIEGSREVKRDRPFYNLDMILSIGYRLKSKTATKFRKWATNVLREHIIKGYTINSVRLSQLGTVLEILSRSTDEMVSSVALLLNNFTKGLDLLDSYDHNAFTKPEGKDANVDLTYGKACEFIDTMKFCSNSELFGNERDKIFEGIIGSIYQTFDGQDLYPSIQEKAANLLYMLVKDHPFTDGNKRIAAGLFIYFLELNDALRDANGKQIIDNNSLAAITLMIALSKSDEKEIMCLLVMNMLVVVER